MRRDTRQRRAIRRALRQADRPLSHAEVLIAAQGEVPGLGVATVYRNVQALLEEGWLTEVAVPGAPSRYEVADKAHHHHFHCRGCDRMYEVAGCPGDLKRLAPRGFRVDDHEIILYGTCPACRRA